MSVPSSASPTTRFITCTLRALSWATSLLNIRRGCNQTQKLIKNKINYKSLYEISITFQVWKYQNSSHRYFYMKQKTVSTFLKWDWLQYFLSSDLHLSIFKIYLYYAWRKIGYSMYWLMLLRRSRGYQLVCPWMLGTIFDPLENKVTIYTWNISSCGDQLAK